MGGESCGPSAVRQIGQRILFRSIALRAHSAWNLQYAQSPSRVAHEGACIAAGLGLGVSRTPDPLFLYECMKISVWPHPGGTVSVAVQPLSAFCGGPDTLLPGPQYK
eukprot:4969505-Prorocentrum_lima.AAC.1